MNSKPTWNVFKLLDFRQFYIHIEHWVGLYNMFYIKACLFRNYFLDIKIGKIDKDNGR